MASLIDTLNSAVSVFVAVLYIGIPAVLFVGGLVALWWGKRASKQARKRRGSEDAMR